MLLAETYGLYNQKKPWLEDTANVCARNCMQQSHWLVGLNAYTVRSLLTKQGNHCLQCDSLQMEYFTRRVIFFCDLASLLICILSLKTEFAESINHRMNVGLFLPLKGVKSHVTWWTGGKKTLLFIRFHKYTPTTAAFLI